MFLVVEKRLVECFFVKLGFEGVVRGVDVVFYEDFGEFVVVVL